MVFVRNQRERAQAMAEYGLLLALIAVVSIASLILFGAKVASLMSTLSTTVAFNV
ncbi:MAG TPA: Flp family type IVb pilin [Chloroflexota bacterium]|jgi:Flp pilus assembly pilin Flp|nr:Flp family type IVb pilin [Chloroflexota bacterium]